MELPPEIRNRIYEYILSSGGIHIEGVAFDVGRGHVASNTPEPNSLRLWWFTHTLCCPRNPEAKGEDEAYAATLNSNIQSCPTYNRRHSLCLHILQSLKRAHKRRLDGKLGNRRPHGSTVNLNILYTCRKIHREAALMPYALNTFAFHNGRELDAFINTLSARQAAALSSLQLCSLSDTFSGFHRLAAGSRDKLQGLMRLDLTICRVSNVQSILGLQMLCRGRVRVVVEDKKFLEDENRRFLGQSGRRQVAEEIERLLMQSGPVSAGGALSRLC